MDQHYNRGDVFLHVNVSTTKEFLVIHVQFSKNWLSSAVGDDIVVIRCINEKVWNVKFSKNNGNFSFTKGWSKVVANLSLSEGCILLFMRINPYNYFLTPFFKETLYPQCDPNISLFTSISSFPNRKYIEAFCHGYNDQSVNTLFLPTYFVKNTIGLGKHRRSMKLHLNSWDSLDESFEKNPHSKCYFFTDGWNNIVQHLGVRSECVVVLRYQFDYNLQLTLFDVNGSEVIIPRIGLQVNFASDLRNATPLVAALFEPFVSNESVVSSSDSDISIDDDFDVDDVEDSSGASDDVKQDPDYHPIEFVWEYHPTHFRLNSKVVRICF
ncbi:putative transcription factor B3-Domain family [Helianthus anomalus]